MLDFWNNPMVVTALRLKFRKGSPGLWCVALVLALLCLAAILAHNADGLSVPLGRMFFVCMVGGVTALCGIISLSTVSASIRSEVTERTLDFQRIVSLSPWQIFLGKAIGEPTVGYFLILSTVPFAVVSWYFGAASGLATCLFYVNMLTFAFMCAAIGTLHSLKDPGQSKVRPGQSGSGVGWVIFVMIFMVPNMMANGAMSSNSWGAVPLGLFTPALGLYHLFHGNVWRAVVPFWELEIPALLVAPPFQVAVALLSIRLMARRLERPNRPLLSKPIAYGLLACFDLLLAGVAMHERVASQAANDVLWHFAIGHLLFSFVLILMTTPRQEMLRRRVWRVQARRASGKELLYADRTPINAMLLVVAFVGCLVAMLGIVAPAAIWPTTLGPPISWEALVEMVAIATLVILSYGQLIQMFGALVSSGGIAWGAVICLAAVIVPFLGAIIWTESGLAFQDSGLADAVFSLSPMSYVVSKLDDVRRLDLQWPFLVAISVIYYLFSSRILGQWQSAQRRQVLAKLTQMGVLANKAELESIATPD
ncbi:hypothetical protein [Adhaeretor mobilis]|uniref:Uncharacterized protein n=1 Tax=Adhaeretor mobilis TaxID=1930276 RepID=A0A517MVB5_9BACT|nr:hypothetical protein [Adhaeretor mobilis]QDS98727.1 hypothetical protein HG15A2_20100 [Adhaeretor mobilis]